jgi:hypothetical protein
MIMPGQQRLHFTVRVVLARQQLLYLKILRNACVHTPNSQRSHRWGPPHHVTDA